ncbi:LTA synthase family protein [Bacteroides sp. 519]|uniref:LTA synthase family protein n=1 Tax=Bacteroides sp. 519 TaxID=2302937 RepID=UPI0013D17679|nr:LTA synthase family protein [Bacteroides sp. 519]NDV58022.1 LTA synthase family protein [Bacteroides sp. 519]
MTKRILYLVGLFFIFLFFFIIYKPFFILYNSALAAGLSFTDYMEVMWHGLTLDSTMSAMLIVIPFAVILSSIWIRKINLRKVLMGYFILVGLVMAIIFVVDASLYEFWDFKLDATVLFYLDSPSNAAASVSTMFLIVRILMIVLVTGIIAMVFIKITPTKLSPILSLKGKLLNSLLMVFVGGVIFFLIRGGYAESTPNIGRVYYSSNQFLNHSAVNPVFSFFSSSMKSEKFANQFNFFPEAERTALFNGLYPDNSVNTQLLLTSKRPDVLIILLESFTSTYIEPLGGLPDITVNLNKLTEEGIFFTNYYSSSFRTDRAVVCALSGHLGLPTASIMKLPVKSKNLPSIAKSLSTNGYKTNFLYGGDINFTNMQSYLRSTGYQELVADKDFTLKQQEEQRWGVSDKTTFEYLYNTISKGKESPWFTTYLTLSNHDPYDTPSFNKFEDKKLNAAAYTDNCLGAFIEKLKQTPAWENLLVICLPDHGTRYPDDLSTSDLRIFHSPMLWLGGAIKEPMKIDALMNQSDLAATLLGQLGIEHKEFCFSRDVFSELYTYPFAFFSYANGFGFKDSTGVSVYDTGADVIVSESPSPDQNRLDRGKAILQTLYDDLDGR